MDLKFRMNVERVAEMKGLTMKQLAHLCGMDLYQLKVVVKRNSPTTRTVNRLAEAWDVSPRVLIVGDVMKEKYNGPIIPSEILKRIMQEYGWSQSRVASMLGWGSRQMVNEFLKKKSTRVVTLYKMAEDLGMDIKYFFR